MEDFERGEEEEENKMKKKKTKNENEPPFPKFAHFNLRRERKSEFVWSKIKGTKHKGPTSIGQFAQCFKYIGTIIPRYTIIK